jgi:hypothetical protein
LGESGGSCIIPEKSNLIFSLILLKINTIIPLKRSYRILRLIASFSGVILAVHNIMMSYFDQTQNLGE